MTLLTIFVTLSSLQFSISSKNCSVIWSKTWAVCLPPWPAYPLWPNAFRCLNVTSWTGWWTLVRRPRQHLHQLHLPCHLSRVLLLHQLPHLLFRPSRHHRPLLSWTLPTSRLHTRPASLPTDHSMVCHLRVGNNLCACHFNHNLHSLLILFQLWIPHLPLLLSLPLIWGFPKYASSPTPCIFGLSTTLQLLSHLMLLSHMAVFGWSTPNIFF